MCKLIEIISLAALLQLELFRGCILVILQAVGVLAVFSYLGHILMYASQDIFTCRLPTARTI
ncbi:hypothetical protein C9446_15785 [Providencia heimbachae]|nr:hypothetical protein C9446_15785 [Providencia heimbachae]